MELINLPPVGEEASLGTKVLGQMAWDRGFLKYLRGGGAMGRTDCTNSSPRRQDLLMS